MYKTDTIKKNYENVSNSNTNKLFETNSKFKSLVSELNSQGNPNLVLTDFKFVHEDTNKLMRYISNFADLKTKQNVIAFNSKHFITKKAPIYVSNPNIHPNQSSPTNKANLLQQPGSGLRKPYEENLMPNKSGKIQTKNPNKLQQQVNEVLDTSEFANEYNPEDNHPRVDRDNRETREPRDPKGDSNYQRNPMQVNQNTGQKNYSTEFNSNIDKLKKDLNRLNNQPVYGGGYENNLTSQSSKHIK